MNIDPTIHAFHGTFGMILNMQFFRHMSMCSSIFDSTKTIRIWSKQSIREHHDK